MRDLQRLFRYWSRVPPVHELVAQYLQVKTGPEPKAQRTEDVMDFLDAIGAVRG